MSNYVKLTDFASKDSLTTGNPLKLIKGTEINDEFNAIQTAVATKADLASPALLGNPTAPTQPYGNNTTRLATTAFVQEALQALHPVGSIYIAVISTNPASLFGFGTWVAFGTGRTLIGINAADPIMDTAEETGGSKDAVVVSHAHTTTVNDPGHIHAVANTGGAHSGPLLNQPVAAGSQFGGTLSTNTTSSGTGISVGVNSTGVTGTNANLPPFITVYMWKRTV